MRVPEELLDPGTCLVPVSRRPFEDPVLALHWEAAGAPYPTMSDVTSRPIVVDFVEDPEDPTPEIVFTTGGRGYAGLVLRVLRGRAPHELLMTIAGDGSGPADLTSAGTPSIGPAHPAAGDLDGDGRPEIVLLVPGGSGAPDHAVAISHDGSELWRTDLPSGEFLLQSSIAIHDLDGDGQPEIVLGRVVLEGRTGVLRFVGTSGSGTNPLGPLSCVADIDPSSPGLEVIAGHAVYASDGRLLREGRVPAYRMEGYCAVADVVHEDGTAGRDGRPEVIRSAALRVILEDGETGRELGEFPLGCGGRFADRSGGPPTVADFDGDGRMEIAVVGYDCLVVVDPGCVGEPLPAGCERRGVLWSAPIDEQSASTSSAAFDFDGDGRWEIVYADQSTLWVFDGRNGSVLFSDSNPSGTYTEGPVVADVDGDGQAEIVVGANLPAGLPGFPWPPSRVPADEYYPGLEIWKSGSARWQGTRPVWNQHSYHVDHVHDAGGVTSPEPESWVSHNTYRANALEPREFPGPDLAAGLLATDDAECSDGVLRLCVDVFNRGDDPPLEPTEVVFYAGEVSERDGAREIARATLDRLLERGETAPVCVDWLDAPIVPTPVFVEIDPSGRLFECVVDNNVVDLGMAACGPPIS